jgi:hypothetical protein
MIIVELLSTATASNSADSSICCSVYNEELKPVQPFANYVLLKEEKNGITKQYDRLVRAIGFRGNDGDWSVFSSTRTLVGDGQNTTTMKTTSRADARHPINGLIIGDHSAAAGTRVFGVGTTLKVWGC